MEPTFHTRFSRIPQKSTQVISSIFCTTFHFLNLLTLSSDPFVLFGDFNTRNNLWASAHTNLNGRSIEDAMLISILSLIPLSPTYSPLSVLPSSLPKLSGVVSMTSTRGF
ncbi:unnamed protein product [Ceratitis capitata]|uniref:(Mediterranean fruit fly) hypothetical protein n=1 Tax=Ceratitis capitata TaxID=7213 RepID=A0A811US84_CERCA|nr:unnamed protein product [Ceratitis capitata]